MSKYDPLWQWIADRGEDTVLLTFGQIGEIAGVPLDHAFLNCKKELEAYGFRVEKISMKQQTVQIRKL